jgi:hypothetical protein
VDTGLNPFANTGLAIEAYCCSPLVLDRCQFAPPPATGLITSAIATQAAPKSTSIKISSLPFTITAPGTYVLTGNLSYTGGGINPAISINGTIAGPVILDLKGFTLTGDVGTNYNACISISGSGGLYPVTIRNGTISKFEEGVLDNSVSNIAVNHMVFDQTSNGVSLNFVDLSTIQNCTFNLNSYGIEDRRSIGGNNYNNNIFIGGGIAVFVQSQFQRTLVLDRCDFAAPPSN